VTNFDVKGKMRYLQITVSLQTRDAPSSDTFKANLPLIQSELLTLMQISQFDEITSTSGKTGFIKRIESNVRQLFKTGEDPIELERAMLTGFVIQ
jgi:flagellar FliL protein